MFVADVTDKEELEFLLDESEIQRQDARDEQSREQAQWDQEDILGRFAELGLRPDDPKYHGFFVHNRMDWHDSDN